MRTGYVGLLVVVIVVMIAAACTADGDKRKSDAGADAGAVVVAAVADAGVVVVPAASDAGVVADIPVVEDTVDAGHMADAAATGPKTPPVIEGGTGVNANKDPRTFTVWNRVLVKAKSKDLAPGRMQDLVEEATGQKVEKVRRTAGTFWLIQFAPVTPVRQKADQQKLIEKLQATGVFAIVEGDQMMTLKTPK